MNVLVAPSCQGRLDLGWLLSRLGQESVTSLLVEGGGEVQSSFLLGGLAHRIAFYYAPKILGGRHDRKAVAGIGARGWNEIVSLSETPPPSPRPRPLPHRPRPAGPVVR